MIPNSIVIFADGASKGNPGPGGWGAIVRDSGRVKELGGREENTTNNRMEIRAAIEALEYLGANFSGEAVEIFSDSSYVINGVSKWLAAWKKNNWIGSQKKEVENRDLWEKLAVLDESFGPKWKYVPGHSGVAANERVDAIASGFAEGRGVNLFDGKLTDYKISLDVSAGEKRPSGKKRARAQAYSYVSSVDGIVTTHKTWKECEDRVKGKSGAKYKKALSPEEEKEIISSFSGR